MAPGYIYMERYPRSKVEKKAKRGLEEVDECSLVNKNPPKEGKHSNQGMRISLS